MKNYLNTSVKTILIAIAVTGLCLQGFSQNAKAVKVFADKKATSVTYAMSHPLHEWEGTSKDVSSVIMVDKDTKTISSVAVLIKVATFDSQNANRDSHMIEAIDGIKFPQVSFQSTSIARDGQNLKVSGNLTFHGITKPVSFQATQANSTNSISVKGAFDIMLTTFAIVPPSLMGVSCKDLVKFNFTAVYNL